jgi:hypothetical protein
MESTSLREHIKYNQFLRDFLLRQTPKDHDELMTTCEIHKDDQDDDATAEKSR